MKRIFRYYLRGAVSYGLQYTKDGDNAAILTGYSDADWAGDINDRKSTSGYLFVISGAVVSWKSRKQTCVALSTAETEYVALVGATHEAAWMRQLRNDLCHEQVGSTVIYEDNQAAIAISQQQHSHSKMKHTDIRYHFVRKLVQDNTIELQYCRTDDMIADILTKGLTHEKFSRLCTIRIERSVCLHVRRSVGESGHACQTIIESCLLLLPLITSLLFFVTCPTIM